MMAKAIQPRGERRWIVLGEDGRHVTMGRNSGPSPDEIARAEAGLADQCHLTVV